MEIGIFVPTEKGRSSIERWAFQSGHNTVMLHNANRLDECLHVRQMQVVIAYDEIISFAEVRQWRECIPEIDWIVVTETPSFAWAEEAILAGASAFSALPITPAHMDAMLNCVKRQRYHRLQVLPGMEQEASSIDLAKPIESALAYITQHISEHLTLQAVSRAVYLSPSHFSRLFVQKVGIHFNDYVLARRIDAAKTLLTDTHLPIEFIALKMGFCSAAYFSQTFKRLTGQSPRSYRYAAGRAVALARAE